MSEDDLLVFAEEAEVRTDRPTRTWKIAVIDDDPAIVAAMRALFEAWGADVAGGESVDQVTAELAALLARSGGAPGRTPDLIVADLRLANGESGIDAVARLRTVCGSRVPALIVSGDMDEPTHVAVQAAGYTLLSKPLVADMLQAAAFAAISRPSQPNQTAGFRSARAA